MPRWSASRHFIDVEQAARRLTNWRPAHRVAWMIGLTVLAICGAANARDDVSRASGVRLASSQDGAPFEQTGTPDLSLWDPTRIVAWRAAMAQPAPTPLAVLRIPSVRLEVPVLPGTDTFILNRAVGHITGTPLPGGDGNSGIAGHRDGFFRTLKDVAAGDAIELDTMGGRVTYVVEQTWIVGPHDVSVLAPTLVGSLTLVTCYPFYFIGPAPQRYIVRAVRAELGSRTP